MAKTLLLNDNITAYLFIKSNKINFGLQCVKTIGVKKQDKQA